MAEMHITKVGDDRYHAVIDDPFTNVDEEVNDSQLMGMLWSKNLIDKKSAEILAWLDPQDVGYELTITYE